MAEPFASHSEARRSRLAGFAKAGRKRAFLAELESLLAGAERVSLVDTSHVDALASEKGLDLDRDVAAPRRRLYRRFLEYCLEDHALSPDESEDLSHLQKLLHLGGADARAVHDDVARSVYGHAVEQVLQDYRLDPEEEQFLKRLRTEIGISDEAAESIREEGAARARHRFLSKGAVPGGAFVAKQGGEIEFEGSSEEGLEAAVKAAIETACSAVEKLDSAELKTLRVDVADGSITRWSVTLTARLG